MSFCTLLIYPPVSFHEQGVNRARGGDPDLYFMPYGMLVLAAELRARGFQAGLLNLSTYTWNEAVREIENREADLYGLSCYTVARHVAARLGDEIRRAHPDDHVAAGGPHASSLAVEWLSHYPAFDTVVIGEGEETLVELCEHLRDGLDPTAIPGTAYRGADGPQLAPPRPPIEDLDSLARPWEVFDYGFLVTSRGCPGQCSFCSSPAFWGRRVRFRSAESVLAELEELVRVRGHRYLHIKDDTFTADRKRALEICQGIVERNLTFRWACDTRVDLLDGEVLTAMRRAGCTKINLGIESANAEVLSHLNKRTDLDRARQVTAMARELGLDIRYYLIAGAHGETPQSLRETFEFLDVARPTHVLLGGLSIYPGTIEFKRAEQAGRLTTEDFFDPNSSKCEPTNLGEQSPQMTNLLGGVFKLFGGGEKDYVRHSLAERDSTLSSHPEFLRSHTDLAVAYVQQQQLGKAATVLQGAIDKFGDGAAELLHFLACVQFARFDLHGAKALFNQAAQIAPQDTLLQANLNLLGSAEQIDYQNHQALTTRLFSTLTSSEFLYAVNGERELTMPGIGRGM